MTDQNDGKKYYWAIFARGDFEILSLMTEKEANEKAADWCIDEDGDAVYLLKLVPTGKFVGDMTVNEVTFDSKEIEEW